VAHLLEPFAGSGSEIVAEQLIRRFGGLGRALSASPEQLALALPEHRDVVATILAARTLFNAGLRERISRTSVGIADHDFREYLRLQIGNSAAECLHVTFVTHDWGYLGDEQITSGASGQVHANLRVLLARAFDLGARGIILAHNHPSGSSEPSDADILLSRRIAALTASVDVQLLDHLIVGADTIVSMRERGLI
jgi:DNA repair protein RadC